MSHSNDNVESRERAAGQLAHSDNKAVNSPEGRDLDQVQIVAEAHDWFYPYASREFVAFDTLYEGGVSAQPPAPDDRQGIR